MADEYKPRDRCEEYQENVYPRRQMRDTLEGPVAVKNMGELYLPMPSAWEGITEGPAINRNAVAQKAMGSTQYLPWTHKNPAYRAYLMRARFPDITANALRMCVGIVTKYDPAVELPKSMEYLSNEATNDDKSLEQLFAYCLSEVLSVGKLSLVVNIDPKTDKFYIATYTTENNINWQYGSIDGSAKKLLLNTAFVAGCDDEGIEIVKDIGYYDVDGNGKLSVCIATYVNDIDAPEIIPMTYRGKPFPKTPVFYAGSISNKAGSDYIPLIGISDCAIAIYQENADLRNAHYMTCNPTLFTFGFGENEKPEALGSQIIVSCRNPQGRAEFPATDTSALDHVAKYIDTIFAEAVSYGASLLATPSKESGEALSIRQANRGASLVHIVNNINLAITNCLKFIAEISGENPDKAQYEASVEFAEALLTSQDITTLVTTWLQGGITQDILLDNMRDAGYIKTDKTNNQIKSDIIKEGLDGGAGIVNTQNQPPANQQQNNQQQNNQGGGQ